MDRMIANKASQLAPLDGLRGFAALLVVLSHTSNDSLLFLPYLDGRGVGKSGVFLFFLLSSFLLARALIKEEAKITTVSVLFLYFQRRFFRIFPLYVPYLLLGLVTTYVLKTVGILDLGIPFVLSFKEFIQHLFLLEGKSVTWSIAVEFKFYFVLPVLMVAYYHIQKRYGVYIGLLMLIILIILSQIISPQAESLQNDIRLLPYASIFLFGIVLAVLQSHVEPKYYRDNKILIVFSYLSIVMLVFTAPAFLSGFTSHIENDHFHKNFIEMTVLWGIVLFSIVNCKSLISTFFEMRVLRFYGNLSFSLYLFHPIFIGIAKEIGLESYFGAWFVLIGSTAAAYLSYRFLEYPASRFLISYDSKNVK